MSWGGKHVTVEKAHIENICLWSYENCRKKRLCCIDMDGNIWGAEMDKFRHVTTVRANTLKKE